MSGMHVERVGTGPRVVLVHGSGSPLTTWDLQLPLGERYALVMPHRRGYGLSPYADPDFAVDAADVAELLDGVHLVGFSYGGVVSLLAAARRPEGVRSLTVLEPPAFAVAEDDPAVAELLGRLRPGYALAKDMTPEEFAVGFAAGVGFTPSWTPVDDETRKVADAVRRERPPWEAEIPLGDLAAADFPKLVISGGWSRAFDAVCDVLERELPAQRVSFTEHGGHGLPHAVGFNDVLETFWASAG